jgi:uncharacterized membrane protein
MDYVISFVVLGGVFALIDAVWLKKMKPLYAKEIGSLLRHKPDIGSAIIFYVLYVFGASLFVVMPAVSAGVWWYAAIMGLLFGAVTYGTYDLTNLATLKGWSKKLSFIDIAWGAILTALSSAIAYFVVVWL